MADGGPRENPGIVPAGGDPPAAGGVAAVSAAGAEVLGRPAAGAGGEGQAGSHSDGMVRAAPGGPRGPTGRAVRADPSSAPGYRPTRPDIAISRWGAAQLIVT